MFGGEEEVDYIRNCLNMFGLLIDLVGVYVYIETEKKGRVL